MPDWISWGTAFTAPSIAVAHALKSDHPTRELLRVGLSEVIGNGATMLIKHQVTADRPCMGYDHCKPDGMPSGHSANGFIGSAVFVAPCGLEMSPTARWVSVTAAVATPILRVLAHRHTVGQAIIGSLIGLGATAAGRFIPCAS